MRTFNTIKYTKEVAKVILALSMGLTLLTCVPQQDPPLKQDQTMVNSTVLKKLEEVVPFTIEALRLRSYGTGNPPALFKELGMIRGYNARILAYKSDGITQYALEHRPSGEVPEHGWPLIIIAHGYVEPSQWTTEGSYISVSSRYAAGGFLVIKPDYRGHGKSEGKTPGAYRAAAYAIDVLNLVQDSLLLPYVDTSQIFLYGHSMGGSVALVTLEVSTIFKAASIWAGVTRPFPEDTLYFLARRDPDEASSRIQELREFPGEVFFPLFSPITYLDKITAPLVIRHGTADESVPFEWSTDFRTALDKAGVSYEFVEYPNANHNISQFFNKALDADLVFFNTFIYP